MKRSFPLQDGYGFYNAFGQCFKVTGLNDEWAAEDAAQYVAQGRAFGRRNMRRLENTFGVQVAFYGRRDEADEVISDAMEDHGY